MYGISNPQRLLLRALQDRCRRTRPSGPASNFTTVAHRAGGRGRLPHHDPTSDGVAAENLQARIRGMAVDGPVEQTVRRSCWPAATRRACRGLQHHLRRRRRWLRADQGRAEDAGLEAGEVAQRRRDTRGSSRRSRRTRSPSRRRAELRPGQKDTDSLPPYELLDDILDDYVEGDRGHAEMVDIGLRHRIGGPGDSSWSTRRSTSAGSTRRAPRSASRPLAATGGCRSPTVGVRGAEVWPRA